MTKVSQFGTFRTKKKQTDELFRAFRGVSRRPRRWSRADCQGVPAADAGAVTNDVT